MTDTNLSPFQAPSGAIFCPDDSKLELSPRVQSLILGERDAEVSRLLAQVKMLRKLNAVEYVARGLRRDDLVNNELVGMMTRAGWSSVEYRPCDPAWRGYFSCSDHGGTCEGPRPVSAVAAMFADTQPPAPKASPVPMKTRKLPNMTTRAIVTPRKKEKT